MENIRISSVCGICAGCNYAILSAKKCKEKYGKVTVFKDIVHNKNVVENLKRSGIEFEYDLEKLSPDSHVILRAHGEPPETYQYLQQHGIDYTDCTCVNAKKIHEAVAKYSDLGFKIIILGKHGKSADQIHPEVVGTMGWCNGNCIVVENSGDLELLDNLKSEKLYLVCQTTFNTQLADELIAKITSIAKQNRQELIVNKSICLAQTKINEASALLARESDLMIVVGSPKSSNSVELAKNLSGITKTLMIEDVEDIEHLLVENNIQLKSTDKIGLTAGASVDKNELVLLKDKLQKIIENGGRYES